MIQKLKEYRNTIIFVIVGVLTVLLINEKMSFISMENKNLIKYKQNIQDSVKTLKELEFKKEKIENFKICNEKKLNDLINGVVNNENCQTQLKIDVLGFIIPKASADEEKITYDNLKIEGMNKPPFEIYSRLKDECFAQDVHNKKHCIKTGLSIAFAECSWKDYDTPFGLKSKDKSYKKWVSSYKKYWYKGWDGGYFYGYSENKPAPTRYCVSEESSGTVGRCKNGKSNFERVFFNLTF